MAAFLYAGRFYGYFYTPGDFTVTTKGGFFSHSQSFLNAPGTAGGICIQKKEGWKTRLGHPAPSFEHADCN